MFIEPLEALIVLRFLIARSGFSGRRSSSICGPHSFDDMVAFRWLYTGDGLEANILRVAGERLGH